MTVIVVIGYKGRKWLPEYISTLRMAAKHIPLDIRRQRPTQRP